MKIFAIATFVSVFVFPLYADAKGEVGVDINVETSVEGSTSGLGAEVELKNETEVNGETVLELNVDGGTDVSVQGDISGDPDFDLFVETVKGEDESVRTVDVDSDGDVEVAYEHEGKFLGLFSVTYTSKTRVETDANGDAVVKVMMPWWSFLVSGSGDVKSEIESTVESDARVAANAEADVSMDSRVKLVEVLVSSVAKADAAVKASYDLKANVK